ncbi:DUF5625 family protein [Methylomonas fluvii]|uniref:DUF5625 domain-containing protein n=1 Tax=Methylomonas fluvii TaxID=1854564 RepID=A0ABR9D9Z2_9GAMM|nr:DUF5625 family protein [Methylomonas fluvii]MBD9359926.1 hypothetical protein [Methylomonas fluvii]
MKKATKYDYKFPLPYPQRKLTLMLMFILIPVIGLVGNSACSKNKDENIWPPVPPIELPFDVKNIGNKVETEFQIIDDSHQLFALDLNYLFKENDQISRKRVWELAGGEGGWIDAPEKANIPIEDTERLYAGKWLPDKKLQAAVLSIKITVYAINGTNISPIFHRDIDTHNIGLSSFGASHLEKQLLVLPLKTGHYKVDVDVLSTSSELNQTPITFKITFPHGGK